MLNEDYREILLALLAEKVEFLLVGAYALATHGYPRATIDIDIWVMPSPDNAKAVVRAIQRFGAPLHNLTERDLQKDDTVFQIGVAPRRIDIITGASGLQFEEAYANSMEVDIEGLPIRVPCDRRSDPKQDGLRKNEGSCGCGGVTGSEEHSVRLTCLINSAVASISTTPTIVHQPVFLEPVRLLTSAATSRRTARQELRELITVSGSKRDILIRAAVVNE